MWAMCSVLGVWNCLLACLLILSNDLKSMFVTSKLRASVSWRVASAIMACNATPFSPEVAAGQPSFARRWLPWNWWSIDGSGWCYNPEWDRLQWCADMDIAADWNGVGIPPSEAKIAQCSASRVLIAVLASACALTCFAFREAAAAGGPPGFADWLRSRDARPWLWELSARVGALGVIGGLVAGFTMPASAVPFS